MISDLRCCNGCPSQRDDEQNLVLKGPKSESFSASIGSSFPPVAGYWPSLRQQSDPSDPIDFLPSDEGRQIKVT